MKKKHILAKQQEAIPRSWNFFKSYFFGTVFTEPWKKEGKR